MALLSLALLQARAWGECALDLAFPWPPSAERDPVRVEAPFCQQCGYPFPALENHPGGFTCTRCADHHWYFDWARAGYRTEGQVHEAISGFKYRDEYYRHRQLVGWLVETFDRHAASVPWDALVPVPLYHRRHRMRGFNQAKELARGLGKARQMRVSESLYRYRETANQVGLERKARWDNMSGAFRLKPGFDVKGLRLLIIDDVFTTGATTNACARALAQAGASQLAVLTISRS